MRGVGVRDEEVLFKEEKGQAGFNNNSVVAILVVGRQSESKKKGQISGIGKRKKIRGGGARQFITGPNPRLFIYIISSLFSKQNNTVTNTTTPRLQFYYYKLHSLGLLTVLLRDLLLKWALWSAAEPSQKN